MSLDQLWRDLRAGVRAHARTPVITAIAIGVLALGIAATSVSFSIVNAFFVRPLPVQEADRFVRIYHHADADFPISFQEYEDIRALRHVFDGAIAEAPAPLIVSVSGSPERIWGEIVSGDYFLQLGVTPSRGRVFSTSEDAVVLSDGFWKRRFGADPDVLSQTLQIGGRPHRVIGIAPEAFRGTILGFASDLWIPVPARSARTPSTTNRAARDYFVMARRAPGVSLEQARAAIDTLAVRLEREHPGTRFAALSESEGRVISTVRDSVLGFSVLTVAIALLVTIVACANVAGILLVRAAARRTEIGVRLALGASRGRIISQLLTEAATISICAGSLGVILAWQATRLISSLQITIARGASASVDVGLDVRVLAVSAGLTMVTTVLCGLTPALEASRPNLIAVLRDGARSDRSGRSWSRRVLLGTQVAVSMILLAGCGLFLRSFEHARHVDLGFDPTNVVMAAIDVRPRQYSPADGNRFWSALLDEIRARPETEAAGLTFRPPLDLGITRTSLAPEGFRPPDNRDWPTTEFSAVLPGYFQAIGIPLVDGRDFTDRDTAGAPPVIILNDVLARRFWPDGRSAIGRYVVNDAEERFEVIGVAKRSKYFSVGEPPTAYVYIPLLQGAAQSMIVVARGSGDLGEYQRAVRETVRRLDPSVPVDLSVLPERVRLALAPAAGSASALGLVSLLALALTSLGLFGAVAQTVGRRTYEIGVRRALGAPDRDVARLVLQDTLTLIVGGLAAGLVAALAVSRVLATLLYDVDVADPLVFGMTPAVLLLVCALATCPPTYRALRINAATALRHE